MKKTPQDSRKFFDKELKEKLRNFKLETRNYRSLGGQHGRRNTPSSQAEFYTLVVNPIDNIAKGITTDLQRKIVPEKLVQQKERVNKAHFETSEIYQKEIFEKEHFHEITLNEAKALQPNWSRIQRAVMVLVIALFGGLFDSGLAFDTFQQAGFSFLLCLFLSGMIMILLVAGTHYLADYSSRAIKRRWKAIRLITGILFAGALFSVLGVYRHETLESVEKLKGTTELLGIVPTNMSSTMISSFSWGIFIFLALLEVLVWLTPYEREQKVKYYKKLKECRQLKEELASLCLERDSKLVELDIKHAEIEDKQNFTICMLKEITLVRDACINAYLSGNIHYRTTATPEYFGNVNSINYK